MAKGQPYYAQQPTAPPPPAYNPPPAYYPPPQAVPSQFHMQAAGAPLQWTTGLCDCCDDPGNCCITCLCPCITFGQIAEILDQGTSSCGVSGALYGLICGLTGCQWIYSCAYRSKIRAQYNLMEDPCNDCCVHFCCEACAICQEYRELKNRGLDPTIGWAGNMARQQASTGVPVPPPVQGGMMR